MNQPPERNPLLEQQVFNIADRLTIAATLWPNQQAVVFPESRDAYGRVAYTHLTFAQLEDEVLRLAAGLQKMGVKPGDRLVLMVKPSLEFIALTFAIFRTGAIVVLIDPGMGRKRIFHCLDEIDPQGFIAIPIVHLIRRLRRGKCRNAVLNVCVGRKVHFGGKSYQQLLRVSPQELTNVETIKTDAAAIIFTSGSTGTPKGVVYEHGMFNAQVDLIQQQYQIQPGERDLPGFPLFALFNLAMGVTTVIPEMNPTRPAAVEPEKILQNLFDQAITQAYGSPAMWKRMGEYCLKQGITWPAVKRVLSAGAPVPVAVLRTMSQVCVTAESEIHTPYGATEALPVCTIGSHEVLSETAALTAQGKGTCVGRPFNQVQVRIIRMSTEPIASLADAEIMPAGEIGEIIVFSPSVTREYYQKPEATRLAKIPDSEQFWHRMGDMGYFDEQGRLWFCGRKAHIVYAATDVMYPVCCEPIFNAHAAIYRSALVGVGPQGKQQPVIIVEPEVGQFPRSSTARQQLETELLELGQANQLTADIKTVLFHPALPVDRRHNVKIHREELAVWAAKILKSKR